MDITVGGVKKLFENCLKVLAGMLVAYPLVGLFFKLIGASLSDDLVLIICLPFLIVRHMCNFIGINKAVRLLGRPTQEIYK